MHRRFCPSNTVILHSKQSKSSYTNFSFQRQSQNSWVACSHMLAQIVWPFTNLCTHFILFFVTFSLEIFLQVRTQPVYTLSFKIRIKIESNYSAVFINVPLVSHPYHPLSHLICRCANVRTSSSQLSNKDISFSTVVNPVP